MKFGDFKTSIDNKIKEALLREDKVNVKKYLDILENEDIKKQYLAYINLEECKVKNKETAAILIDKVINGLPKFESKYNFVKESDNKFYKAIDYLREENFEIEEYSRNLDFLVDELVKEKPVITESKYENPDLSLKLMVNNFNEKYGDIQQTDEIIEVYESIFSTDENKENVFINSKSNLLSKLNESISKSNDSDEKTDLLNVKEKVLDMKFDKEQYIENIISFHKLIDNF